MITKSFAFARERMVRVRPLHLLAAAAFLHLATALVISAAGSLAILPAPFAVDGLGLFAFDSVRYQREAKTLAEVLSNEGFGAWLQFPIKSHLHPYSLCLAIFSPMFGYSVLAVEPLNLLYYLGALTLIYQIGKQGFGKVTGTTAAIIIGVWPSFLLHTTQFLKDPLFIVCMLAIVFVCLTWLTRICSWSSVLLTVSLGAASMAVLAWTKSNMWESVVVSIVVGFILLLVRQALARRIFVQNMLSAALILTAMLVMPVKETEVHRRDQSASESIKPVGPSSFFWKALGVRIAERRRVFNLSKGPKSNIDEELFFNSTGDVMLYLPRATVIGLFTPFPRIWLDSATTGRAAHLLTGAETLFFYLIALAAGVCVYVERRNFATWFLLLVALTNIVALGLVVTNIGTLFRLRYVFWMLIIILGVHGAIMLARNLGADRATASVD